MVSIRNFKVRSVGIRDVAKKAGVAVGTVSRVLNDHPSVTAERRALIKSVIAELNYRPDVFAQSMRKKTSKTIGVIIPDLKNPFFAELIDIVERELGERGYNVFLVSSRESAEADREHMAALANRKVDGLIVIPSQRTMTMPVVNGIPLVVVDRPVAGRSVVGANHRGGARLAVRYLLSLGHVRIACIAGLKGTAPARDRLAGYLDVMRPQFRIAGLTADEFIAYSRFDYEGGRTATNALLSGPKQRPTAIFASSDQQAIGALRLAADLNIRVPEQLSIVGFDGIPVSDLVTPRLTTVAQPIAEIARAAVGLLLKPDSRAASGVSVLFDCLLIKRDSCARVPA